MLILLVSSIALFRRWIFASYVHFSMCPSGWWNHESAPFKFSQDYMEIMGGTKSDKWERQAPPSPPPHGCFLQVGCSCRTNAEAVEASEFAASCSTPCVSPPSYARSSSLLCQLLPPVVCVFWGGGLTGGRFWLLILFCAH